ncbi:hypothetical protein BJX70DRAFT_368644 [Aspergillus crustosus]
MDYPISISSDDDSGGDYGYTDAYNFYDPDGEWGYATAAGNSGNGSINRPSKRARVRGPDDTAFDEVDFGPLASLSPNSSQYPQDTNSVAPEVSNAETLLLQVLEIFPDISHTYVKDLIDRHRASLLANTDFSPNNVEIALSTDAIYEEILGHKSYPKQESEKGKRKRDSIEAEINWEDNQMLETIPNRYSEAAASVLANEFLSMPMQHIRKVLRDKERLRPAYLALLSDANLLEKSRKSYVKLKKARVSTPPKNSSDLNDILTRELIAAKKHNENLQNDLNKKKQEEEAERANEEDHIRTGNLIECQCCYADAPANRCIPCDGADLHFFCFTCIRRSAETQIGLMKYTLQCFDVSGCQASFARPQLRVILGSITMDKIESLQQEDEIQKAALDGLEECPFCSFKAILPPVEEDKEFRCEKPDCKMVSCRLCEEESHIPMTCQEAQKDKGVSQRHEVEEAMSKALIRTCPKCQVKIVKESGCNKMICTKCATIMCYICQKNITNEGYNHFGRGTCYQDDSSVRDQEQVEKAQKAAIAKILAQNPDISEEQLRVELPKTHVHRVNSVHRQHNIGIHAMAMPQQLAPVVQFHGEHRGRGNHGNHAPNQPFQHQPPELQPPPGLHGAMINHFGGHNIVPPNRGIPANHPQAQLPDPAVQLAMNFRVMNANPGFGQPSQHILGVYGGQRLQGNPNNIGNFGNHGYPYARYP